ncbi:MAG TPA: NAD-glutamate dehydrogenase, partial [Kiloniellales bacterium]|nr:NAD-glutamate dehydrogenase [Kiloniellales bacterium]
IARETFAVRALLRDIEALDNKVEAELQYAMLAEVGRTVERVTVWFLRHGGHPLDIRSQVETYEGDIARLADALPDLLAEFDRSHLDERIRGFAEKGVPEELARRVARLDLLAPACDIVRIARGANLPALEVARSYFAIGARFGFDWLRRAAGNLPSESAWDKLAVTAIVDDLYGHQSNLTARVVDSGRPEGTGNGAGGDGSIERWANSRPQLVARTDQLLAELEASGAPDLAMLAVANRQLRSMVEG